MSKKRKSERHHAMLDNEEKSILEDFENGNLKSVDNLAEEKAFLQKAASNYLRKNVRINIRLSSQDLDRIKQVAAYEGLPYQTMISSVLHKFAIGYLQENQE